MRSRRPHGDLHGVAAHRAVGDGTCSSLRCRSNHADRTGDRQRQLRPDRERRRIDKRPIQSHIGCFGRYSVSGLLDYGSDYTYVSAPGYESDYRFISGMRDGRQDFRLHPIERIPAGESKVVTVAPDDSLCVNNVQDMPGVGPSFLCRSLRVLAPSSGVLTIEVLSPEGSEHPRVEVETVNASICCDERIENPTSIRVAAGIEVRVSVEVPGGTTTRQLFIVNTSLKPE